MPQRNDSADPVWPVIAAGLLALGMLAYVLVEWNRREMRYAGREREAEEIQRDWE